MLSLCYGDKKVGEELCVGRDSDEAVTDDGEPYLDLERQAPAMLARE